MSNAQELATSLNASEMLCVGGETNYCDLYQTSLVLERKSISEEVLSPTEELFPKERTLLPTRTLGGQKRNKRKKEKRRERKFLARTKDQKKMPKDSRDKKIRFHRDTVSWQPNPFLQRHRKDCPALKQRQWCFFFKVVYFYSYHYLF